MKPEEVKTEIAKTTSELKNKKALLTKFEKERDELAKTIKYTTQQLEKLDSIISGKAHTYYSEKEYAIPVYSRYGSTRYTKEKKLVAKVKYSGLYEDVKALEEQLAVLKILKTKKL